MPAQMRANYLLTRMIHLNNIAGRITKAFYPVTKLPFGAFPGPSSRRSVAVVFMLFPSLPRCAARLTLNDEIAGVRRGAKQASPYRLTATRVITQLIANVP